MEDKVFIHGDVDGLKYFTNKDKVCAYDSRVVAYAMQDADIVGIFYTQYQARSFYENNRYKDNLPTLYYWDEDKWDSRNKHSVLS